MEERILITGATGFVGGWLTGELRASRPEALLFGTTHRADHGAAQGITLLPCDITRADSVESAVRTARPNRVIHLAGVASAAGGDGVNLRAVNADAAVTLLRSVARLGSECRVLLASSGYVYGATAPGHPAREADPLHAIGAYAESKVAMEAAVAQFFREEAPTNISVVLARAFNHTGPRQTDAFVVPAFAKQIARIEKGHESPVVKVGNLDALRDFLHVRDVARAYRQLACELVLPDVVTPVNVASGVGVTIRAILDDLIAMASVVVNVETDSARLRPSDLSECVGNFSFLTSLGGWAPRSDLHTTLRETLDFWRAQPV